jgi:hypothetical protein
LVSRALWVCERAWVAQLGCCRPVPIGLPERLPTGSPRGPGQAAQVGAGEGGGVRERARSRPGVGTGCIVPLQDLPRKQNVFRREPAPIRNRDSRTWSGARRGSTAARMLGFIQVSENQDAGLKPRRYKVGTAYKERRKPRCRASRQEPSGPPETGGKPGATKSKAPATVPDRVGAGRGLET